MRRNKQYKEMSLEAGRDMRFPSEEQRKRSEEWFKRNRENS